MATGTGKTRCVICDKVKATIRCGGCLKEFCFNHWGPHQQELNQQLDEIELNRDIFRQSLTEQSQDPNKQILIKQINEWERNSIRIIQETAEEARQIVLKNINEYTHQLELKFDELTKQLRESRQENDFNEINLRQYQEELDKLNKELTKPSNISIREDSTSFISKISVQVSKSIVSSIVFKSATWIQNGATVAGGNGYGSGLNQFDHPIGIYVDDDQTVYVADAGNNRIVEWKSGATTGRVVAGGNGSGNRMNQLNWPVDVIIDKGKNYLIIPDRGNRRVVRWSRRDGISGETIISNIDCSRLAIDKDGYLYVSDDSKHEVRQWKIGDGHGILVAGGNGKGNRPNQLNQPQNIFVDEDYSIYISDWENNRVMKWIKGATEGVIVAGGHGYGNSLSQLSYPQGFLFVDQLGTVYVADRDNHRIMCWLKGATKGKIVVGGHGAGENPNQLNSPYGLSFDQQRNLYVVDCGNCRIQRFSIDCT